MSKEKIAYIDEALKEIYAQGDIQKTLEKAFFVPDFKASKEAAEYLKEKNDKYKEVLDNITD